MADRYIELNNGVLTEKAGVTTSVPNAIPALDGSGKLALDMLPAGVGAAMYQIQASQNLAAGDAVNIHDSGGQRVRKADNGALATQAHGFVRVSVNSGEVADVYTDWDADLTGLTIGATYYLGTAGAVVLAAGLPTAAGSIVQRVGVAVSTTKLDVEIGQPVVFA